MSCPTLPAQACHRSANPRCVRENPWRDEASDRALLHPFWFRPRFCRNDSEPAAWRIRLPGPLIAVSCPYTHVNPARTEAEPLSPNRDQPSERRCICCTVSPLLIRRAGEVRAAPRIPMPAASGEIRRPGKAADQISAARRPAARCSSRAAYEVEISMNLRFGGMDGRFPLTPIVAARAVSSPQKGDVAPLPPGCQLRQANSQRPGRRCADRVSG